MEKIINQSLATIDCEFRKNELAYLALTTKIEHPLRDRWAFRLHEILSGRLAVSREWKRTDIALLEKSTPKALIELKAMYTFDAALDENNINGYIQLMDNDKLKAKKLANEYTQIYTVLFATHPTSIVPANLEGIIKYRAGINKAMDKFKSSANVQEIAIRAIRNKLKGKNVISSGCLNGGKTFDIETNVLFWIIKA